MQETNILIHVVAGTLAIFIGVIPYITKKGGPRHLKYGRIFLWLMATVILTATLGVLFFRDRPFLTVVTIQSFYMATSGYRALQYKEKGPGIVDFVLVMLLIGGGTLFVFNMQQANILWHSSVVFYLLGVLFLVGAYDLLRIFNILKWRKAWLPEHFLKMTSAYSALFSAGMGTVFSNLGAYSQIVPAMLSTVLLIGVIWRFGRKKGIAALSTNERA